MKWCKQNFSDAFGEKQSKEIVWLSEQHFRLQSGSFPYFLITVECFYFEVIPPEFCCVNVILFSSCTFSVRYRWSMCSKNSIWLLLNECMICRGTEAEAHDKPVSPSYQNTSTTTVIPLSGLHLCRFLCAVLHIFLACVGNLLLCCAGRRVGLWRFLVDLDTLNVVLLMVPWLMTCSDTDRCWPWCRC